MLRLIASFYFIAIFCTACNQKSEPLQQANDSSHSDSLAKVNDPKNRLNIQTNLFYEIDSSGILMFPLSMGETRNLDRNSVYRDVPDNGYWNIIFYNSKTKQSHLLSNQKMLIENYGYKYLGNNDGNIQQTTHHIFYTIKIDDFNKDKKLAKEDPRYLFVTDKSGHHFRQISPKGYHLINWKYINSTNTVILTAVKDTDKNYKFDHYDEVSTFEIELKDGTKPAEVFTNELKNQLKTLFSRDWRRIEE